jgi:hypothetical protein
MVEFITDSENNCYFELNDPWIWLSMKWHTMCSRVKDWIKYHMYIHLDHWAYHSFSVFFYYNRTDEKENIHIKHAFMFLFFYTFLFLFESRLGIYLFWSIVLSFFFSSPSTIKKSFSRAENDMYLKYNVY